MFLTKKSRGGNSTEMIGGVSATPLSSLIGSHVGGRLQFLEALEGQAMSLGCRVGLSVVNTERIEARVVSAKGM